jgi:hypothetical protein
VQHAGPVYFFGVRPARAHKKGGRKNMKKMNIYNGENYPITVVTEIETVIIGAKMTVQVLMGTDADFNSGDFYVQEDGSWYAKENGVTGADLEIYNAVN